MLQTPYKEPAISDVGAAGDLASNRGGRPLTSGPGGADLVNSPHQSNTPTPDGSESPNSLSGLPGLVSGISAGEGDPGRDSTIDVPDLDALQNGRTLG